MKILVKREQSQTGLNFDERGNQRSTAEGKVKFGLKVKRLFQWVMAAILICGATVFTSCSKDDNPVTPDLNVSEKIMGKWMKSEQNGQPLATDKKMVYTFVSPTKAYMSASIDASPEVGTHWITQLEADVTISGNKVSLITYSEEGATMVVDYIITAIDDTSFTANHKVTITLGGAVVYVVEDILRFEKVTVDYAPAIIGMWECTGLSGGETYNDANARLEFLDDGTYRYYQKNDGGQWEAVTTREFQEYFVDGYLINTRWKDVDGQESREWWEIESLSGDQMVWTALRQNPDGSTFQQKMTWKRIDLKVAEKILGKWMTADKDGNPAPTDEKSVFTFISTTKAIACASKNTYSDSHSRWSLDREYDVEINGNYVKLTSHSDGSSTMIKEFAITSINDAEFVCRYKHTSLRNGQITSAGSEQIRRYVKVPADFREAIVGTWEGRCTSEGSVFDDGQEHRWQYKADGTYVYYVKDGDDWVPSENTLNEYFVDGTLLCTRWVDNEQENREWWEINIDGDKMNWTALRQKEDGSTFTATFEMTKVQ